MRRLRRWLAEGWSAAQVAGGRADLWPAGALAELVALGWLVLAAAVVPLPSITHLTFLAVDLATSTALPLRVAALAAVLLGGLVLLRLIGAIGQVAVLRGLAHRRPDSGSAADVIADAGSVVLVQAVAFLPAVAAAALVAVAAVDAAERVWQQSDVVGAEAVRRLVSSVTPFIGMLAAALVLGQMLTGPVVARLIGGQVALGPAIRAGWRRLAARPASTAGVAATALVARLIYVAACWATLRTLWQPVAAALDRPDALPPLALPLLLGFVLAWLSLVAAFGTLHVWFAAWWVRSVTVHDGERFGGEREGARWTPSASSS